MAQCMTRRPKLSAIRGLVKAASEMPTCGPCGQSTMLQLAYMQSQGMANVESRTRNRISVTSHPMQLLTQRHIIIT